MKLFEPIEFAGLHLANRIVMPAMGTGYANEDGTASDRLIDYYGRRAQGGPGMIILEHCLVHPEATGVGPELRCDNDAVIPSLTRLTARVKSYGVKVGIQLNHPGKQTTKGNPVAPSAISLSGKGKLPRALTLKEIDEIIDSYAEGARRMRDAGFDLVEIHGAHGYLVGEFLSPFSNQRTDEYGGSLEKRTKFALEIVERIQAKVGKNFPIQYRLSGSEFVEGGLTLEDTQQIAKLLEAKGVSSISVSAGNWLCLHQIMPPMFMPRGCLLDLAAGVKQAVNIPVIAVGRLGEPALAERVLQEGKADLVAIGRGMIADPDWPTKVKEGRSDDVRLCLACNTCVDRVSRALDAKCTVNAEVGHEGTWNMPPTAKSKNVMVVGGGPAGMEFARLAKERGHNVSLYEKGERLGGKIWVASYPPGKSDLTDFARYLTGQLDKLGVTVNLKTEVTSETVKQVQPDVLVVAGGAGPFLPPIPGIRQENVVQAEAVLEGTVNLGESCVVIGGSATGCETAEYLLEKGKKVLAIIEMLPEIGIGLEAITARLLLYRLKKNGVRMLAGCKLLQIEGKIVTYSDPQGNTGTIEVDNIVTALGFRPDKQLAESLQGSCQEVYFIGDFAQPGTIENAVAAAAGVAAKI